MDKKHWFFKQPLQNSEHSPHHKFTEPLLWWGPTRSSISTSIFTNSYWWWNSEIGNDNTFWIILAAFPFHLFVAIFIDIDRNITVRFSKNGDVKGFFGKTFSKKRFFLKEQVKYYSDHLKFCTAPRGCSLWIEKKRTKQCENGPEFDISMGDGLLLVHIK